MSPPPDERLFFDPVCLLASLSLGKERAMKTEVRIEYCVV